MSLDSGSNTESPKMSRRDFIKVSSMGIAYTLLKPTIDTLGDYLESPECIENDPVDVTFAERGPDEMTSFGAVRAAVDTLETQLCEGNRPTRHSSLFAGMYLKYLGFEVERDSTPANMYEPDPSTPCPETMTSKQVAYLRELSNELGDDLVAEIPVEKMLSGRFDWQQVPPGTLLYLPHARWDQHAGSYTHATIFMGLDSEKKPLFAEYSGQMRNGPQYGKGLREAFSGYREYFTRMRNRFNPNVFMFDAVEASRRFDLEDGHVIPDGELFKELGYDSVVALNVNSGRLGLWEITDDGSAKQRDIAGRGDMFAIVGRRLKRNRFLGAVYHDYMEPSVPFSTYDSGGGRHIDSEGVVRRTYTPLGIFHLKEITTIGNFGGLGSSSYTDTTLLGELYRNQEGEVVTSELNSYYTLHDVPRGTEDQEILLRERPLSEANSKGEPLDNLNLSSGCVNLDADAWRDLKEELEQQMEDGKNIALMFSTFRTNQNDLIKPGSENSWFYGSDPFGRGAYSWPYGDDGGLGHDSGDLYTRGKEYPLFNNKV